MTDEHDADDDRNEFEQARVAFRRQGETLLGGSATWNDLSQGDRDALIASAKELAKASLECSQIEVSTAIADIADYTGMNKNEARSFMNDMRAERATEQLTFHKIEKVVPHDPERDPVLEMKIGMQGKTEWVRLTTDEFLRPVDVRVKLTETFDRVPELPKRKQWISIAERTMSETEITERMESQEREEHAAAGKIVNEVALLTVTDNEDLFRSDARHMMYYDEEAGHALVSARILDRVRSSMRSIPSGAAVTSVLQHRGFVPLHDDAVREFGDGYFRVWEFRVDTLIEEGVIPAESFENPISERGEK